MASNTQQRSAEEEEQAEREFLGEGEVEQDVAALQPPQEAVMFRSKGVNFRAVMVARHRTTMPNGEVRVHGSDRHPAGKTIEFAPHGEYTTDDPEEIDYLRSLPTFNLEFWQVGAEPHAIPSPRMVMDKVMAAAVELDDATLATLEEDERKTWNRAVVLESIRSARQRVQGATATTTEG